MPFNADRIAALIDDMLMITGELTTITGRSFAPDGHMVGSIGEVLAAQAYNLELMPASTKGFDAMNGERRVEIKATFGDRIAFRRHGSADLADHCLVLKLSKGVSFDEIYNGPMQPITALPENRVLPSNGQIQLSLTQLRELNDQVDHSGALPRLDLKTSETISP